MKVWMIDDGSYSDYHVVGLYSSREIAEEVLAAITTGDAPQVHEMELDKKVSDIREGYLNYGIRMEKDGKAHCGEGHLSSYDLGGLCMRGPVIRKEHTWDGKTEPEHMCVSVWARDKEHAVKIANETRLALIASGAWDKAVGR